MPPSGLIAVIIAMLAMLLAPLAFIALVRYFDHRETMRRLERFDSGELARLDLAELRMRERWRIRSGILGGACAAALGVAVLIGLWWAGGVQAALHTERYSPAGFGVLIGLGIFLILVGALIMIGHFIWSRRSSLPDDSATAAPSPTPTSEA